jgi:multidrug efflux system membrane fusion protein
MKSKSRKISLRLAIILLAAAGIVGGGIYYIVARSNAVDPAANGPSGGMGPGGPSGPGGPGGPGQRGPQPVAASEVKVKDVPIWINAIGTMIPKNLVTVRSRTDGELLKLHFTEGQVVKAGQLLAELDPRAAQVQLTQANGQLARDSAQLKNAQIDLERYRTLLEKDSIARQQVDTQEALVRQYQGTVEVDRGLVAAAKLQLDYTRITAPVAGRIGLRQVDPGNLVRTSDTNGVVVIAQVQPITVVFSVPEINLPVITQALAAKEPTVVEVWDRELKQRLASGKLLTADNQIDTATGTLKIKAEFRNEDNSLFPNQFVNVRLSAGVAEDAKVVPGSAVLRGAKGNFVYAIEDGKVTAVPVQLGTVNGDQVVIEGRIRPGTQVVTDGADKLRDGAQVNVISAEAREKATSDDGKRRRGKRGPGNGEGATSAAQAAQSPAPAQASEAPAKPADSKAAPSN